MLHNRKYCPFFPFFPHLRARKDSLIHLYTLFLIIHSFNPSPNHSLYTTTTATTTTTITITILCAISGYPRTLHSLPDQQKQSLIRVDLVRPLSRQPLSQKKQAEQYIAHPALSLQQPPKIKRRSQEPPHPRQSISHTKPQVKTSLARSFHLHQTYTHRIAPPPSTAQTHGTSVRAQNFIQILQKQAQRTTKAFARATETRPPRCANQRFSPSSSPPLLRTRPPST